MCQVLNAASEEDNLIDLGPGSPAVVTPRIISTSAHTPASTLQPPDIAAASLSTQLAGLSEDQTHTYTHTL